MNAARDPKTKGLGQENAGRLLEEEARDSRFEARDSMTAALVTRNKARDSRDTDRFTKNEARDSMNAGLFTKNEARDSSAPDRLPKNKARHSTAAARIGDRTARSRFIQALFTTSEVRRRTRKDNHNRKPTRTQRTRTAEREFS